MLIASVFLLLQTNRSYTPPTYFVPVVVLMLVAGLVMWLVAAVLGFARARAFGPSTRWFAIAAVFMLIYHLQFLLIALGIILEDPSMTLGVAAFFNLFAVLAAICSILGFVRLTQPR